MTEFDQSAPELDSLTSGYSGRMLLFVSVGSIVSNLGWLVIPPLLPAIRADLGITTTQAGIALTVLTGLAAVGRFPGGRLADLLSRKTVFGFCILAWLVGFSVLAGAVTYPLFLLGAVFVGLGLGMFVPTAFAQLSDLFDRKQGRAFGVNNAAFNLGGILASGLAIAVLAVGPWRLAFLPILASLILLAVLLTVWSREPYVLERPEFELLPTVKRLLFDRRVRTLLLVAALFSFVWNGAISFLPTFLEADRGLTATVASIAFSGLFLTGVVATPLSGALGDRFGNLRIVLVSVVAGILGLALVVTGPTTLLVVLGVLLFAVGITGFWPVMTSYMMAAVPDASKGGDYGAMGTVYMGVGSIGPTYVGAAAERIGFTAAYVGLGGCLGICLLLVGWLLWQD